MSAGLFSFPILTRLFSIGDYGILGLITTTILIGTAVAKFGLPDSVVRFYAEFKSSNQIKIFYSTLFFISLMVAIGAGLFFAFASQLMYKNLDRNFLNLSPLVSILIFTGCITTILSTYLRAEQRTKLYNFIAIIQRYGSLSIGIFFVLFFFKGLYGFYFGQVISGVGILLLLIYIFRSWLKINSRYISKKIIRDSVKFGFPLVWAELGYLVLNYVDRYLIQSYLGSIPLGLYTAGYNLSTYVTEMFMYSVNYAMGPIFMDILTNKGEEEAKVFFAKTFRYFILIMLPIVFGFLGVGRELIVVLASSKYIEAHAILPYVVIAQLIHACGNVLNLGLFVQRKTYIVTLIVIVSCLVNIGSNIILIPKFGIVGAAQATLISYSFYSVVVTYYAFREFRFDIPYSSVFLYLSIAISMYFLISVVSIGSHFGNLLLKTLVGAIFYSLLIFILDKDVRRNVLRTVAGSGIPKDKVKSSLR
jgi:O-antigen/teichoic acid export membrane protein